MEYVFGSKETDNERASLDILLDNLPHSNWHKDRHVDQQGDNIQEKQDTNTPNEYSVPDDDISVDEHSETSRSLSTQHRILRDAALARRIKDIHQFRCQICSKVIHLPHGRYAEAHHIKPLGTPHNGPDIAGNILCVCPNHHIELDYGAIQIESSELKTVVGHVIDDVFINYHNTHVFQE